MLLIIACGMLVQSSSMAVQSCWMLPGSCCRTCGAEQPEHPKYAERLNAVHARTGVFFFSASRNLEILDPCDTRLFITMLQNEAMVADG